MPPICNRPDKASASCDNALHMLFHCLTKNTLPPLPPELEGNEAFATLLQYISEIRSALAKLSQGDFHTPIAMRGHTGGLLKAIQGNVRHMLWMLEQVAEGKLSHHIDHMGDLAERFNCMTRSLQEAKEALERQKALYAELAGALSMEVEGRIKAQEELKYELERQRELASTDGLTGVANRRFFLQMASHELEHCRRNRSWLCLSMLDVDYFKAINDAHGHQVGDLILRHLTAAISRNLRAYDMIGRYGGDEFIILFPGMHLHNAANSLTRLHQSISADDFTACGGVAYTISAGLAAVCPHQDNMTLESLIAKADRALYLSKERGRNCVTVLDGAADR